MPKEVKIFNNDFIYHVTDIPNLTFLDFEEEEPEVNSETQEIKGTDGVMLGPIHFGPFNLNLNFAFKGLDTKSLILMKAKLRRLFCQEKPFYIWHSDEPGKKYAVYCNSKDIDQLTNSFATFKVTFVVYKGYSESYRDTAHMNLLEDLTQFEQNFESDESLNYRHKTKTFKVFNGSDTTIDPLARHRIVIKLSAKAPNGFTLKNRTTGDTFVYKKALKKDENFVLNGVYPYLDNKRVGINTNNHYISLKPGFNNFSLTGDGLEDIDILFDFNFIYR
ncbi:phage tail domain-containing protein [Staphylococcus pettenkoferi]|uniref:phage tail domain-containing protein n=1 Tax=Staphylococcus pettenkoferi TaxID=170573 RepID=UPI0022758B7D|nr:phage tail domain-containing protein [Staphylococcus pettenkoferi]MCY1589847.1 phage tail family protein [Staphylococcus pettenkoferi]MCY1599237.1 phage tail family protein [Staphylococcus pettenkoferi]MCY1613789.1 phage tail family protein [Staphylococcus pettenkoferi]